MNRRVICGAAAMLVLAVLPSLVWAGQPTRAKGSQTTLTLKDLNGQQQTLADHRGKIVLLNFWATWCIPCIEEMPLLRDLQRRYGVRDVQVIGASADNQSTQETIAPFVRKHKIDFPILIGATTADMQTLGLGDALPATAIIDRDGQIVGRILGPVEKDDLKNRIEWLLGDRQSPPPQALVNNIEKLKQAGHKHKHVEGEENHEHGGVGVEGASTVPS